MIYSRLIGGVLLVSGTAIGAGILALPVSTGMAGFFPSSLLLFVTWGVMTLTALMMLEVNLWMKGETNLISMARHTLGKGGEAVSWIAYLFLLYALLTAYIAGGGPIMLIAIQAITGVALPHYLGGVPLLILFGFFVYRGTAFVDHINRALMVGLVLTYALMMTLLMPHIDLQLLKHVDWAPLFVATSVVVTSFGFHIIIPTLTTYLDRNVAHLRMTILIGSVIPLLVYLLWEYATLGIIPLEGDHGIVKGHQLGSNGAYLLSIVLNNSSIATIARFFSFFTIVTSFLGVSLSLFDFLADGLKIKKTHKGRLLLYLLTFLPPMAIALTDPRAFLSALEYAGAFGVVTLLILLPALMVWRGRYHWGYTSIYKAPGGKWALILAICFGLGVVGLEIMNKIGM